MILLRLISYLTGLIARASYPAIFVRLFIKGFVTLFKVDVSEAAKELDGYASLAEFFSRELKPGLRPVAGDLVSPVDGVLRSLTNEISTELKGKEYPLEELLGSAQYLNEFKGASLFNFYLSPRDYHRVHSPVSGKIVATTHIPGALWPVNDLSNNFFENLMVINERIVIYIESPLGLVALVMVAATNVGNMTLAFDNLSTNSFSDLISVKRVEPVSRYYEKQLLTDRGDHLGTFNLGSSVVLLVKPDRLKISDTLQAGSHYKYGTALGCIIDAH